MTNIQPAQPVTATLAKFDKQIGDSQFAVIVFNQDAQEIICEFFPDYAQAKAAYNFAEKILRTTQATLF